MNQSLFWLMGLCVLAVGLYGLAIIKSKAPKTRHIANQQDLGQQKPFIFDVSAVDRLSDVLQQKLPKVHVQKHNQRLVVQGFGKKAMVMIDDQAVRKIRTLDDTTIFAVSSTFNEQELQAVVAFFQEN